MSTEVLQYYWKKIKEMLTALKAEGRESDFL